MVESCRKKYPGVRFEQGDARNLSCFENETFSLVVFSWSGISMVDHDGRMAILNEIYRVLKPGGYFIFSTYNRDNKDHEKILSLPSFVFSSNPIKLTFNTLIFFKNLTLIVSNRMRFRRYEKICAEYAIVNDKSHNYSTMLYYITLESQKKQLIETGFKENIDTFDSKGAMANRTTNDDSILYLARK